VGTGVVVMACMHALLQAEVQSENARAERRFGAERGVSLFATSRPSGHSDQR